MAVAAPLSVEHYLATTWEPDREFVDGELLERGMPTLFHMMVAARFTALFLKLSERFPVFGGPEGRVQIAPQQYRVPDVALYRGLRPTERVATMPPVVVVEILSPDDKLADLIAKFRDYANWGVEHCWLVDPETRDMYVFANNRLNSADQFALPEFDTIYTAVDIFGAE